MRQLIGVELFKLRTVRTTWWLGAGALALVAVGVTLTLGLSDVRSAEDIRSLLSFAGAGGVVVLLLGVVAMAGEYRHRTIVPAVLLTPRRMKLVIAKAVAAAIAGAAVGLVCVALAAVIAFPWLAAGGVRLAPSVGELGLVLGGSVLYCALSAVVGVSLGALAANQAAAVGAALILIGVIDPTVSALVPDYGKYSLSGLGVGLSGGSPDEGGPFSETLPAWSAALLYSAYGAALLTAGIAVTARREIA